MGECEGIWASVKGFGRVKGFAARACVKGFAAQVGVKEFAARASVKGLTVCCWCQTNSVCVIVLALLKSDVLGQQITVTRHSAFPSQGYITLISRV